MKKGLRWLRESWQDDNFLRIQGNVESIVSKILLIGMLVVILMSVYSLAKYLVLEIQVLLFPVPTAASMDDPLQIKRFAKGLFTLFGLFLNVLIALEIVENITAYLKRHIIQVELVIGTSLIAVARKIIILDLEKTAGNDLIALAVTILALSAAYWVVRKVGPGNNGNGNGNGHSG